MRNVVYGKEAMPNWVGGNIAFGGCRILPENATLFFCSTCKKCDRSWPLFPAPQTGAKEEEEEEKKEEENNK